MGADGVEMDVRMTGDGQVAVVHDRDVEVGDGRTAVVGGVALAETNEMRSGAGLPTLPTLSAVFAALPSSFLVDVELKVRSHAVGALTAAAVEAIRASGRLETTLVKSHNPLVARHLRRSYPDVTRGYVWGRSHPWPLRTRRFRTVPDAHWIAPSEDSYDRGLLRDFHRLGRRVLAWDVDVPDPSAFVGIDAVDDGRSGQPRPAQGRRRGGRLTTGCRLARGIISPWPDMRRASARAVSWDSGDERSRDDGYTEVDSDRGGRAVGPGRRRMRRRRGRRAGGDRRRACACPPH